MNNVTGQTMTGKPIFTIPVVGITAAYIEKANRASFHGIRGNQQYCAEASRLAHQVVRDWLEENRIPWNAFWIWRCRTVDTSGTPTPYKALIDFTIDPA